MALRLTKFILVLAMSIELFLNHRLEPFNATLDSLFPNHFGAWRAGISFRRCLRFGFHLRCPTSAPLTSRLGIPYIFSSFGVCCGCRIYAGLPYFLLIQGIACQALSLRSPAVYAHLPHCRGRRKTPAKKQSSLYTGPTAFLWHHHW